jgi:hypothetical protein
MRKIKTKFEKVRKKGDKKEGEEDEGVENTWENVEKRGRTKILRSEDVN